MCYYLVVGELLLDVLWLLWVVELKVDMKVGVVGVLLVVIGCYVCMLGV